MNSKFISGAFISVEGIDAAGKTTNIPVLAEHLRERGYKVITTREPGGTVTGNKIREILLRGEKMESVTELFLFLAARNEHTKKVIVPHLQAGYIVIADRYHDSTFAYQGYGRGMLEHLKELGSYVWADRVPDITLFFDLPFEESVRRLALRSDKQDRMDLEEEDFRRRVYQGYQQRLGYNSANEHYESTFVRTIQRIDALPEPTIVSESVKIWANTVFENLN